MKVTKMPAILGRNINEVTMPRTAFYPPKHGKRAEDIFSRFEKDDYILLGIIAVLVFEGCDDYILLAALGYLFIMGIKE